MLFNKNVINDFLTNIFNNLSNDKIDVSNFELDHICYRVESEERYFYYKNILLKYGKILSENIIGWREITTFKLDEPIIYKNRQISVLELPSPKVWSDYKEWFEHIEFVIKESFEEFIKKYNYISFDLKDINKKVNPDIRINYKNSSVKFHHNSLEYIINNFE